MTETTDGGSPGTAASEVNRPERRGGAIVWTVRVLAVLLVLDLFVQVTLAGLFITGDVDLLKAHSMNASIPLSVLALLLVIASVLLRWPGKGPVGPMWWSIVLLLLLQAQSGFGFARQVAVHVPLGVGVVAMAAVFTSWVFRYRHDPAALEAKRVARKAAKRGATAAGPEVAAGDAR